MSARQSLDRAPVTGSCGTITGAYFVKVKSSRASIRPRSRGPLFQNIAAQSAWANALAEIVGESQNFQWLDSWQHVRITHVVASACQRLRSDSSNLRIAQ